MKQRIYSIILLIFLTSSIISLGFIYNNERSITLSRINISNMDIETRGEYMATFDSKLLFVYNISNPSSPELIDKITSGSYIFDNVKLFEINETINLFTEIHNGQQTQVGQYLINPDGLHLKDLYFLDSFVYLEYDEYLFSTTANVVNKERVVMEFTFFNFSDLNDFQVVNQTIVVEPIKSENSDFDFSQIHYSKGSFYTLILDPDKQLYLFQIEIINQKGNITLSTNQIEISYQNDGMNTEGVLLEREWELSKDKLYFKLDFGSKRF